MRLIHTKQAFRNFIAAMGYFDKLISGGRMYKVKAEKYYLRFIEALIDFSLMPSNKLKFDPYIIDSFHSLRQHKQQMVFDMDELSHVDENYRNLVLYSCEKRDHWDESQREGDDLTNLFQADLLSIFPNIEQVILRTTAADYSFSLSMDNLLSIISSTSLNIIEVDSYCYADDVGQGTWINTLWQSESDKLTTEFASNGFTISFEQKKQGIWQHFKFIIVRIVINKLYD